MHVAGDAIVGTASAFTRVGQEPLDYRYGKALMPVGGLSLVGFLPQARAAKYLRSSCANRWKQGADRVAAWTEAKARLGSVVGHPGRPDIQDLPNEASEYLAGVPANARFVTTVGRLGWSFQLVEIAPLLAFQFHVCTGMHTFSQSPLLNEMLHACLPQRVEPIAYPQPKVSRRRNGGDIRIECDDLNLVEMEFVSGALGRADAALIDFAGVAFGPTSPFVQVVRLNGACFLRNGFHRCYQLGAAGATHVPCILLEGNEFADVGARGEGATFEKGQLLSPNPPTIGHFIDGRAYPVKLRRLTRIIEASWRMTAEFEK